MITLRKAQSTSILDRISPHGLALFFSLGDGSAPVTCVNRSLTSASCVGRVGSAPMGSQVDMGQTHATPLSFSCLHHALLHYSPSGALAKTKIAGSCTPLPGRDALIPTINLYKNNAEWVRNLLLRASHTWGKGMEGKA